MNPSERGTTTTHSEPSTSTLNLNPRPDPTGAHRCPEPTGIRWAYDRVPPVPTRPLRDGVRTRSHDRSHEPAQ